MQRKCWTLRLSQSFIEALESRRFLSAGALDTSFSGDGKANASFSPVSVNGTAMTTQPDGKVIDIGSASDGRLAIVRFNANGTPDLSYGLSGNGKVILRIGKQFNKDKPSAVATQSDGKIVIVGQEFDTSTADGPVFIIRFTTSGKLDTSFSGDGIVELTNFHSTFAFDANARAVAIQKDGKIVVGGFESQGFTNGNDNFVLARLNTNGSLDASFGVSGKLNLDLGEDEDGEAIAINYNGTASTNPDYGKIVIAGTRTTDGNFAMSQLGQGKMDKYQIVIARYTAQGALDKTFNGTGGLLSTAGFNASIDVRGVLIESNGSIVVAGNKGSTVSSTDHDFFLARFSSKGALDKSFNVTGSAVTNMGGDDRATSIILAGYRQRLIVGGTSSKDVALAAYDLDGRLDTGFGSGGKVITSVNKSASTVALALEPVHALVAAGGTNFNTLRYFDISPKVSVTPIDSEAGEPITKKVGRVIIVTPNPASLLVSRDMVLPFATRVYFTIGGTATPPTLITVRTQTNDYTLAGMSGMLSTVSSKTIGGYVDIPANEAFATITLTPFDDTAIEPTETAMFSINPSSLYDKGAHLSSTISILDNDSPSSAKTLSATADAYVKDGTSAGTNFGSTLDLQVKFGATGFNRQSFLKFDLSTVSTINSVKLQLFGNLNNANQTNLLTSLFSVADTTWTESGITFTNAPAAGANALATATILDTTLRLYEFDVTAYVKTQKALGHNIVSFVLKNSANSLPIVVFNSREAASNQPKLAIT